MGQIMINVALSNSLFVWFSAALGVRGAQESSSSIAFESLKLWVSRLLLISSALKAGPWGFKPKCSKSSFKIFTKLRPALLKHTSSVTVPKFLKLCLRLREQLKVAWSRIGATVNRNSDEHFIPIQTLWALGENRLFDLSWWICELCQCPRLIRVCKSNS